MDENVAIVKVTQKQQHIAINGMGGLRGLTGPKGEAGAGLRITGSVDTYGDLPSSLGPQDAGKAYFNQADGKLYVWSGERFPAEGQGSQFVGPEGPAGPTGYSPTASVSKSGTTTTITITDKNGTTTAEVEDGSQLTDGIINGAANDAITVEGSKIALSTVGTPNLRDNSVTEAKLAGTAMSAILNKIYPVGSIYMSASLSTAAQVEEAIGGTWIAWGSGRVPVGVNTNDANFNTVEKTGGANTSSHKHMQTVGADSNGGVYILTDNDSWIPGGQVNTNAYADKKIVNTTLSTATSAARFNSTLAEASSTLQPYITCYMYKRTA